MSLGALACAAMGEPGKLTRRAVLRGAAAAGAASLAGPLPAAAAAASSGLDSRRVGRLRGTSAPIRAPRRFALAAVQWSAPASARIELRAMAPDGRWTPWVSAVAAGHDPDGGARVRGHFGEPLWTGQAVAVQLRAGGTVEGVRVHFVSPGPGGPAGAAAAQALALAQPVLDAGPGQPPIIARRCWAEGQAPPGPFSGFGSVKLAFVHHTVNPNGYSPGEVPALLRGIFDYHRYVRGYFDIAYNFLIDAYGRIWEGRAGGIDMPVIGAQAGGYNMESTGVAMLGDFMAVVPPAPAMRALEQLVAWKLSLHGVPAHGRVTVVVDPASAFYTPFPPGAHVSLPRIAGHRDGDLTDCPGDALYHRLGAVRRRAIALAGVPASLTATPPALPVSAGAPATVGGRLALLSGAPLAGAPIEVQRFRSRAAGTITLATVTSGADGTWSQQLTLERNTLVRALHAPAPAAVSDWLLVTVAPILTLSVQSTAPLVLSGTVTPGKPHVRVELYRAPAGPASGPPRGRPFAHRRVPVSGGQFTARFDPPPGDYVVVARTPPDPVNAAGSSAPLAVTVA